MAITANGIRKDFIYWGLITKIEIREQGTGSFVTVGRFKNAAFNADPLTVETDPAGGQEAYAVQYNVAFDIMQSSSTELAWIDDTASTGLFSTNVEVRLTFASGRTITLGDVTASPLRLTPRFKAGSIDEAQIIPVTGSNVEAIDTFNAKVA